MNRSESYIMPRGAGVTHELASICKRRDWVMICENEVERCRVEREYNIKAINMHNNGHFYGHTGPFIWDHTASYSYVKRLEEEHKEMKKILSSIDIEYFM